MKKAPKAKQQKIVIDKSKPKKTSVTSAPKVIKNVREALFLFQNEAIMLPRRGEGKTASGKVYKYVTLDDLINTTRPFLEKYGLGFTQLVQTDKLETKLFHFASDTELTSEINLGKPTAMQDYGGRITYGKRYALAAILGLSSEEDVDAVPMADDLAIAGSNPVKPAEAPKQPTGESLASRIPPAPPTPEKAVEAPVQAPAEVVRSMPFDKARVAITTAYSQAAIDLLRKQIGGSERLIESEKAELLVLLNGRELELKNNPR